MSSDEIDRPLEAAASANPELAAMLSGRRAAPPRPRYGRLALLLVVVAAVVAAGWFAVRRWSARPHEAAVEIDRSIYLFSTKAQATGPGEVTSPFTGFAVSIDTDPPGAVVTIGGKLRGEAPVLAEISCRGSEKVEIRAEKKGFRPARRELGCRADTLVKMTLRLER